MTVKELIAELEKYDWDNPQVVISNVLNAPFATYSIKEIIKAEGGPLYLRAKRNDKE